MLAHLFKSLCFGLFFRCKGTYHHQTAEAFLKEYTKLAVTLLYILVKPFQHLAEAVGSEKSTIPTGSRTSAKRRSRNIIITIALTIFTIIPESPGSISTLLLATTTVSLVRRLSHSPECTALTVPKSLVRILSNRRCLNRFSREERDNFSNQRITARIAT